MTYHLGVDLGTTYTAAAVLRHDHAQTVALGGTADTIASVVLLREDGMLLTGESALRRGATEPQRLAREFKRRFGQPEPILLGGTPYSPEALTAQLLRSVVATVTEREGGPPERICLSHPANWGAFKRDLFEHVVRLAEIKVPVVFVTEPEAAALAYAREQRVDPEAVVAVYDLGGGTFDAAVLRRHHDGFAILGRPEGIEQLGGIDVDAAVFHHVVQALDGALEQLDEDDPVALAAVARLRRDCVEAKEALSSDTDVAIPVVLPGLSTQVRLTREELERMVRPMLTSTVEALRRALESAQVTPEDLASVLLVGGSSRMPIVAQLVGAELGRPVVVDAHPKHVVALGAAWFARGGAGDLPATEPALASAAVATPEPVVAEEPAHPDLTGYDDLFAPSTASAANAPGATDDPAPTLVDQPAAVVPEPEAVPDAETDAFEPPPPPVPEPRRRGRWWWAALAVVLIGVAAFAVTRFVLDDGSSPGDDTREPTTPLARLQAIVDADRDAVTDRLLDKWAPQLDIFVDGVTDQDGVTYDPAKILAKYEELSETYDVLLVYSGDYPSSFGITDGFAPMVMRTFDTAEDVLAWCDQEKLVRDDCFAKRISESGKPGDHLRLRPKEEAQPAQHTVPDQQQPPPATEEPTDEPTETDDPFADLGPDGGDLASEDTGDGTDGGAASDDATP